MPAFAAPSLHLVPSLPPPWRPAVVVLLPSESDEEAGPSSCECYRSLPDPTPQGRESAVTLSPCRSVEIWTTTTTAGGPEELPFPGRVGLWLDGMLRSAQLEFTAPGCSLRLSADARLD